MSIVTDQLRFMNENVCRTLESFIVLLSTSYNKETTELRYNNRRQTNTIDLDRSFSSMGQTGTYIITVFGNKNHNFYHNKVSTI
jgi:hypothetical protein